MRGSRQVSAILAALLGIACTADKPLEPLAARVAPSAGHATLYPASRYRPVNVRSTGVGSFTDVSDGNLMVGWVYLQGVYMPLGGTLTPLSNGGRFGSRADGVNRLGEIAGRLYDAGGLLEFPAVWLAVGAFPASLPDSGRALDINNSTVAVGELGAKLGPVPFVWNVRRQSLTRLPLLPGHTRGSAVAINDRNIIIGRSDLTPVIWSPAGGGWRVRALVKIDPADINQDAFVVGDRASQAAFGTPDFAGYFSLPAGSAWATGVNSIGVATGVFTPSGGWTGGPVTEAFVAERGGATTRLPLPPPLFGGWEAAAGRAINKCGLVVGEVEAAIFTSPAYWDPGC